MAAKSQSKTQDRHPAIGVKNAILARSGVYEYSYDEMLRRGIIPKVKKDYYKEYRPPEVLIRNKDKFAFSVVTKEHTALETTPENFRKQASGTVGDSIEVVTLDDGNVGLQGKIAFYTQDVASYFDSGVKETSADYRSVVKPSDDPSYDFVLEDIVSVNGLAITQRGRGGSTVRVLDSMKNKKEFSIMSKKRGGILANFLGVKKSGEKYSASVFKTMKELRSIDSLEDKEKKVTKLLDPVLALKDGEDKEYLVGVVQDCLTYPDEVEEKKEEVSRIIDGLYEKCTKAEEEASKKLIASFVKDAFEDEKEEEKKAKKTEDDADEEDEKKEEKEEDKSKKTEDSKSFGEADIEKMIEKAISRSQDSVSKMVDEAVKKALGIDEEPKKEDKKKRALDSILNMPELEDSKSFLLSNAFGE